MIFSSFEYVLFLWSAYVLFWTLRNDRPMRHSMLLVASYWFYAYAEWRFAFLLVASTVLDYECGLLLARSLRQGDKRRAKLWMGLSLTGNLGMLGTFKYYDFFAVNFSNAFQSLGLPVSLPLLQMAIPVGISFYTFQTLSYTLDIYRGRMQPTKSLLDFALYVSFFPQLVAGPIVRAVDFIPQLERPPLFDSRRVSSGLFQILRGMSKKLLIADVLGAHVVDPAFRDAATIGGLGGPGVMLATYAYSIQLYCDFSGYSDIAIGSARLLGFELCKNFDAPYRSKSLEEVWRRWHISMSSWFTDYLYHPLGGSRLGFARGCVNVMITWTLIGLWHGADWPEVLWGVVNGVQLVIARSVRKLLPGGKMPEGPLFSLAYTIATYHAFLSSLVIIRCPDLAGVQAAYATLFDWSGPWPTLPWQMSFLLAVGYVTHFLPESFTNGLERAFQRTPGLVQGVLLAACVVLFFALHPPGLAPFIYFQF